MTTYKRYTPESIIKRAEEIGIILYVVDGNLHIEAAKGAVTPRIIAILKEYKQEILPLLPRETCYYCSNPGSYDGSVNGEEVRLCKIHSLVEVDKGLSNGDALVLQEAVKLFNVDIDNPKQFSVQIKPKHQKMIV